MTQYRQTAGSIVIRELLVPLARLCLKRGLRMQEVGESLKEAFVIAAEGQLAQSEESSNVSRLAVLTGLQRRDVKRLQTREPTQSGTMNLLTKIIGQWRSESTFCDSKGNPLPLSVEGAQSEFAELVRSISADMNPYTVLFALRQASAIEEGNGVVVLKAQAYVPSKKAEEGYQMLAEDSRDLYTAVQDNIEASAEIPHLHLTTVFDNVCKSKVPEIKKWLLEEGSRFQERVRAYLAKFDKDANARLYKEEGGVRVAVCAFSICEAERK